MATGIIKIKDKYFFYSTVVDAPVSKGLDLDELKSFYEMEYGRSGMKELPDRLKRVEENGSSFHGEDLESTILCNRAGEDESEITIEEIYERYT